MTAPKDDKSTEDSNKVTAGTLREWIKQEVAGLIPGKSTVDSDTPAATPAPTDIRAEVKAALGELKSKDDREARDAKVDALLKEREDNAAKAETPPVERRKVEKFMRWGD